MKAFCVVFLAAALALDASAEPCGRVAKWQADEAAPATQADLPPARVDPNLEGKTVKVYFRDGRVYEGKLVELTDDALRLKMGKRIETIPLTDVARVERKPRNWALPVAIVGAAAGVTLLTLFVVVASSD